MAFRVPPLRRKAGRTFLLFSKLEVGFPCSLFWGGLGLGVDFRGQFQESSLADASACLVLCASPSRGVTIYAYSSVVSLTADGRGACKVWYCGVEDFL